MPPAEGKDGQAAGAPVETQPPNAPDQKPAAADQTRAPQPGDMPATAAQAVVEGLPQAWAMQLLPNDRILVTAKEGAMHVVYPDGKVSGALAGVPDVDDDGMAATAPASRPRHWRWTTQAAAL